MHFTLQSLRKHILKEAKLASHPEFFTIQLKTYDQQQKTLSFQFRPTDPEADPLQLEVQFVYVSDMLHSAEAELYLLTLWDRLVLTVGSFGWWAAFLNSQVSQGLEMLDEHREFGLTGDDTDQDLLFSAGNNKQIGQVESVVLKVQNRIENQKILYYSTPFQSGSDLERALTASDYWPPFWTPFQ